MLTLTVRDDGVGFDPAQVAADRYGLAGMHERAEAIGARLAVRSKPGLGTTVELSFVR
jgi:two-component system sensor histidine kinase DegS